MLAFSTSPNSRSSPRAVLDFYFRSRAERKEGGGEEEGNKGKEDKRGREVGYYHPSPFLWEPILLPPFLSPLVSIPFSPLLPLFVGFFFDQGLRGRKTKERGEGDKANEYKRGRG